MDGGARNGAGLDLLIAGDSRRTASGLDSDEGGIFSHRAGVGLWAQRLVPVQGPVQVAFDVDVDVDVAFEVAVAVAVRVPVCVPP